MYVHNLNQKAVGEACQVHRCGGVNDSHGQST